MLCAAMQNMRPNCPPPKSPSHAPGTMKRSGLAAIAAWRHTHRTHGRSLLAAKLREFLCERGIGSGQHGNSEERRVGGARVADGEGGDRHAFGHLHDGIQGIYAVQMRGG